MYSTDQPDARAAPGQLGPGPGSEIRLRMAAALNERSAQLSERWADALLSVTGGIYANVPRDEVLSIARRLFAAYVEHLQTGDTVALQTTVIAAARRRFEAGCPLVSLLETVGAARITILPVLSEEFAAEPAMLAQAVAALMAGEETVAVWIAEAYEEVAGGLLKTAESERLQAERDKVVFGREITRLATNDRLILCDATDIGPHASTQPLAVVSPRDVRHARGLARDLANELNWSPARAYELQLCVGEAVTNAIRHAGTATFQAWADNDNIAFRIADSGPGIDFNRIPSALSSGYSTGASLGMGFTLMLELADTIRLATDSRGTVLQLTLGRR